MKTKQVEQKGTYLRAFRAAFPYTVPVLTGYLFIGMAFGVMIQEKGYNFLWAMLMSLVIYAGSGQYLAVNFFAPGVSLFNAVTFESYSVKSIAKGLYRLYKNPDLCRDLSLRGLERSKQFTWERSAEKLYAIYKELANE